MKKGAFSALLYRELLLCRKVLIDYLITSLIFLLIPVLVILSLQYGNLTMLPEFVVADVRANNDLILVLAAVISPCMLVMSLSESSVFDAQIKWDRFRRSTPVKPAQMALAKYVLFLILLLASVVLSSAVMVLCHGLLGSPVRKIDFAVIMALVTIISILCVTAQVFTMLFRSMDKGMVAMIGFAAAMMLLIPAEWKASLNEETLLKLVEELLPLTPLMLAGILLVGFGLTTFIYARREK